LSRSRILDRQAESRDVQLIHALIRKEVIRGRLQPRSLALLREIAPRFQVEELNGVLRACMSVDAHSQRIWEFRSLTGPWLCRRRLLTRGILLAKQAGVQKVMIVSPLPDVGYLVSLGFHTATSSERVAVFADPSQFPDLVVDRSVRRPSPSDVLQIHKLIARQAHAGHLLPRTIAEIEVLRRFFLVVRKGSRVAGCVALEIYSSELAEVRSLVVDEEFQDNGIGQKLLEACLALARDNGISEVMAVTSKIAFFERCGFARTIRGSLGLFLNPATWDPKVYLPDRP